MRLKVYNTRTKHVEPFTPLNEGKVGMYVCGMTVYDDMHIGHARTYVAFDVIHRYLRYRGYDVTYVQNVTDVDDKIINRARERDVHPHELAATYTKRSREDQQALGILPADTYPTVTDHIGDIVAAVEKLVEKGHAYDVDGDVYFDIATAKNYGILSNQDLDKINTRRLEANPKKRNPSDFVLWKKVDEGEYGFQSPWGYGRPGWHIECSVMSQKYLGDEFDIHGGARDLIFPHHDNEVAQSEALTGKSPFVRYWLHTGFLESKGEKMSKSLGNILPVREFLKKYDANVFRLFILQTRYTSPIDYSEEKITATQASLEKLATFRNELTTALKADEGGTEDTLVVLAKKLRKDFVSFMDADFDSTNALAALYDFVREANLLLKKDDNSKESLQEALETFNEITGVFGLSFAEEDTYIATEEEQTLIEQRKQFRAEKNWAEADRIRAIFEEKGLQLIDKEGKTIVARMKQ